MQIHLGNLTFQKFSNPILNFQQPFHTHASLQTYFQFPKRPFFWNEKPPISEGASNGHSFQRTFILKWKAIFYLTKNTLRELFMSWRWILHAFTLDILSLSINMCVCPPADNIDGVDEFMESLRLTHLHTTRHFGKLTRISPLTKCTFSCHNLTIKTHFSELINMSRYVFHFFFGELGESRTNKAQNFCCRN